MLQDSTNKEFVLDEMERTKWHRVWQTFKKDWRLYVLLFPMLLFLILFKYFPIYGILEAFKLNVTTNPSVFAMDWQGIAQFRILFRDAEFWQALRNTFVTSMYGLVFGFPIPIFIALLFSEVKNTAVRSILQVCTYLPRFISTVIITSIILLWCKAETNTTTPGIMTLVFNHFGWISSKTEKIDEIPRYFRSIYQISGIWENAGYGSIVYFAAIMAISPTNYEAAKIDGASKLQQIRYITFPGMAPTLTIMLIMRIGNILAIGYEKVLLLYNERTYETADVVSTFVYRKGLVSSSKSLGIAGDIFNSLLAMCLVLGANAISRRVSNTSLF